MVKFGKKKTIFGDKKQTSADDISKSYNRILIPFERVRSREQILFDLFYVFSLVWPAFTVSIYWQFIKKKHQFFDLTKLALRTSKIKIQNSRGVIWKADDATHLAHTTNTLYLKYFLFYSKKNASMHFFLPFFTLS